MDNCTYYVKIIFTDITITLLITPTPEKFYKNFKRNYRPTIFCRLKSVMEDVRQYYSM